MQRVLKASKLRMPGIEVVDLVRIGFETQPGILAIGELHPAGAILPVRRVDRKRFGYFVRGNPARGTALNWRTAPDSPRFCDRYQCPGNLRQPVSGLLPDHPAI